MKRTFEAFIVSGVLLVVAVVGPQSAYADSGGNCVWDGLSYDCTTQITQAGSPSTSTAASKPGGLQAGPSSCALDGKAVPCSNRYGWFVDSADCVGYVRLSDAQPAPPPGEVAGGGAYYTCTLACQALNQQSDPTCAMGGILALDYWSDTPPPGIDRYTPAQAAAALARTFRLTAITIGMAPARKTHVDDPAGTAPYRRTWVGIPVWLWVADPTPLTYGPYSATATLGGVTVTATASVSELDWSSGDGQQVRCGAGTRFDAAAWAERTASPSPSCGITFQHTSTAEPGGTWQVTATSRWSVAWTGGGQTGTIQLTNLTAGTPVTVGELQSVNVPVTSTLIGGR